MSGPSSRQTLELAAHLGDTDAMRSLSMNRVDPDGFEAWAWKFNEFGREAMLQAALVAANMALLGALCLIRWTS